MKQETRKCISDVDSFDREVSIHKILFQDRTISLLKKITEQMSNDRYDRNRVKYPSILLIGNSSKRLIAEALCNTLCFNYEQIQGDLLGNGGQYNNLYENIQQETLYHILLADKLTHFSLSFLLRFLKQGYIILTNPFTREKDPVHMAGKLFVFSATSADDINKELLKLIDHHCYLNHIKDCKKLTLILEQRLRWCNIGYDKAILPLIVSYGQGSISNCINLLKTIYCVARSDYKNRIEITDVQMGLNLYMRQGIEGEVGLLEG